MMGAHELMAKSVMYEEAVHVPLLVRVPFRQLKAHHVAQPVSSIDIVPTVMDLLAGKDMGLSGRSLVPMLEGATRPDNFVFLEWAGPEGRTVISPDGYKLVLYDKDQSMLFDRNRDPQELRNVYGKQEYAAVQAKLRKKIEEWQRQTKDQVALPV